MRKQINLTIFFVLLLTFTCKLYAQQYDKAAVKISQNPIDITTLAKTIAKQTGLQYSLNMQNASLKKHISLHTGNWRLSDILKQVQQQAGLNYRIMGDHILFMDYQPPVTKTATTNAPVRAIPSVKVVNNLKPKSNNAVTAKKTVAAADKPKNVAVIAKNKTTAIAPDTTIKRLVVRNTKADTIPRLAVDSLKPDTAGRKPTIVKRNTMRPPSREKKTTGSLIIDNKERIRLLPIYAAHRNFVSPEVPELALFDGIDSANNKKMPSRFTVPSLMKSIATAKTKRKKTSNKQQRYQSFSNITSSDDVKWYKPLVKAGISADEILYLNASLMAGIKYVYGIISYGSTFPGGRLRWGAGIPVKLNDEQQLHFTFTTGTLKRRTNPDTLIVYGVKETLTRYGAGWSKTVTPRITFQAQLHYNILKKTSDSTRAVVQNLTSDYGHFEYGSPSHILSGSYGENGDFRRWLGLQISLFYKLF